MPSELPATPPAAGEKETLAAFLDRYRRVVVGKLRGLSREQAAARSTVSQLTLLGIVKHLAYVERWWFREVFRGEDVPGVWSEDDPDAELRVEPDDTVESVLALYAEECDHARRVLAGAELDQLAAAHATDRSLRWIALHMIEETARHAGHADIIREAIDGATGD